jgi:hypothetical protein
LKESRVIKHRMLARRAAVVVGFLLMGERVASAYADPGSGALLWQILVAGFVGALFHLRRFLDRFRNRTRRARN